MAKKYVVTVGRQFGSMGRPIAKRAAELLGIEYYDRDIVEEVAKRMDMPLKLISREEEEANHKFGTYGKMLFPLGNGTTELQDRIFSVQECVLEDFADRSSCILVGRCGDYLMRDRKNLLRVFIYAPMEERTLNCVQYFNMTPLQARKMCADVDKARRAYHLRYAGYEPMDPEHMDLLLNSTALGIEGTAQALADLIRRRFDEHAI